MLVSKVSDLNITHRTVGPSDNVLLCFTSDNLKVVDSDQLPHDGKGKLFVTILDILSTDAHQFQLKLDTSIKSYLAINTFLEIVVRVLFHSIPFNYGRVNLVNDFQENLSVSAFLVQIVNVHILKI